jgi:hypothetical protein
MKRNLTLGLLLGAAVSGSALAQDLTGTWQQIDDKSGSPKAIIEISKESNGTYYRPDCENHPASGLYAAENLQ